MNNTFEIDAVKPVIDPSTFVHPAASIIGHVVIGKNCYIGPHASLRGDFGKIIIEDGANIQDSCVVHGFPNGETRICENGHISHGAVIHGCVIGENSMIGINAVVMDNAQIGKDCMVGALSYVKPNFQAPDRSVIIGSPAEIKRPLSDKEINWKTKGTGIYQNLTTRCLDTFKACEPLTKPSEQKNQLNVQAFKPLK